MNAANIGAGGPVIVPKIVDVIQLGKISVTNDHGENLGKIESIMLDLETGKIAYVVVGIGGFPNRTKLFAVPWELLAFSHHDRKFILNITKDIMTNSPGYDTIDQVIQNPDFTWLGEVYEYFSHTTEWQQKRAEERNTEILKAQQRRQEIGIAKKSETENKS